MSEHRKQHSGFAILSLCVLGLSFVFPPGLAGAPQNTTGSQEKAPGAVASTSDKNKKPSLSPDEQRQADLEADTEKLYQLTQELKAEVAKSNKDTLSVSVVKKAQEIERLAKSIKDRSRTR